MDKTGFNRAHRQGELVCKAHTLALHLALVITFAQFLNNDELEAFMNDMESSDRSKLSENWYDKYQKNIEFGSSQNATFALHVDIMRHCDNVTAVALAERLGGPVGYSLLLAAVKGSLLFSFVNNASSYALYCVKLLYEHYSAGIFHRHLKETLFSTPFKTSNRSFACDAKREMDHLDVLKGFRSGSNASSVTCRMSLIDSLNETRHPRACIETQVDDDQLGMELTPVDEAHIFPAGQGQS
ncbi:hypothetical protein DPMN_155792 [Dreissena polymorpha]|uniref:Uncharacterized protein n=1 Tax=Dreissena polymorpha TaxID=45954 RepID=A0A9D4FRW2_DREPO|nr:hypothetical protein DPMN_155792 [Dreissena polymorpha]